MIWKALLKVLHWKAVVPHLVHQKVAQESLLSVRAVASLPW